MGFRRSNPLSCQLLCTKIDNFLILSRKKKKISNFWPNMETTYWWCLDTSLGRYRRWERPGRSPGSSRRAGGRSCRRPRYTRTHRLPATGPWNRYSVAPRNCCGSGLWENVYPDMNICNYGQFRLNINILSKLRRVHQILIFWYLLSPNIKDLEP